MTTEREPLPVERLVSDDQRRLEIATASTRPIPASNLEENRQLLNQLAAHRPRFRPVDDDAAPAPDEIDRLIAEIRNARPEERKNRR
jgi:hypothetical protein